MNPNIVDSLPYLDHEINDSEIHQLVINLIADETQRYKQTKNYLELMPQLPPLELNAFETEILKNEFDRMTNAKPMEQLNMKRYELPSPTPDKLNDIVSWQNSLNNSMAQLHHQLIRIQNLELLEQYGTEAWSATTLHTERMVQFLRTSLEKLKKELQEVNLIRKNEQTTAGEKLKILEEKWVELVSKNYDLEGACDQLESEINSLKSRIPCDS
ncbi:gamma-soluble NSF attachment protein-like [Sarcoptes scabiei]|uniref:Pre-mRNA-splicing factor SPF27 n=1 Tax=Sarcoptes scabiei TaxID=52283 RepID=A0A132A0X7_SARSC|nr:BCAS2-like protein [Sarcoptes scabiei]UXI19415.1 gamma-soluble NSF attachment protein-like [Sarcoptes scabiei]